MLPARLIRALDARCMSINHMKKYPALGVVAFVLLLASGLFLVSASLAYGHFILSIIYGVVFLPVSIVGLIFSAKRMRGN
jgi:hypothetical protein